jgi:hypothetical protein
MNENIENPLLELVNSSGYPLQIGIENIVKQSSKIQPWSVIGREHFWRNKESNKEGFIDLILSFNNIRMVIECKRVLEKDWIFLVTDLRKYNALKVKLLNSLIQPSDSNYEWVDIDYDPRTIESQFCIMGREKDRPSLEKLSSDLILAMESLAIEERSIILSDNPAESTNILYVPVIITTATLHMCSFHPDDINLDDGKVSISKFEELDLVRFRKGLSTASLNNIKTAHDIKELNKLNEQTVFVIQANKFLSFLSKFDY